MITVEEKEKTEYEKKLEELKPYELQSIIENFDVEKYESKRDNYSNVFYLMNLRENTHSEILTWLFDIKENDINKKNSLRYNFVKKFFEYLKIDNSELAFLQGANSQVTFSHGRPDIVIETKEYILVIEVKLDAKINITMGKTQFENYWDDLKQNKKKKKFIFIYPEETSLDNKTYNVVNIGGKKYCNQTGNEIIKKLDECGKHYECIQFSDIVLILYKILKDKGIIKKQKTKEKNKITASLIKEFIDLLETNTQNKISNKNKIDQTLKNIKSSLDLEIEESRLKEWDYRKPLKCNIKIKDKLKSKQDSDIINNMLVQYVEHWLYCNTIIDGYTEIIEYNKTLFYIIDICNQIYKNDKLLEKIEKIKRLNTYKA